MRWRSVANELPLPHEPILVYVSGVKDNKKYSYPYIHSTKMCTGVGYRDQTPYNAFYTPYSNAKITHWCFLDELANCPEGTYS